MKDVIPYTVHGIQYIHVRVGGGGEGEANKIIIVVYDLVPEPIDDWRTYMAL